MRFARPLNEKQASGRWLLVALLVAVVYPVVGIAFSALDGAAAQGPIRIWRLAAWLASAATFFAHLAYEHLRSRRTRLHAAMHASLAVAVGAFLLAVWVNLHGLWVDTSQHGTLALLALIVFPLVTGVPAFVAGLATLAILGRLERGRG